MNKRNRGPRSRKSKDKTSIIRDVWFSNYYDEISRFDNCLQRYKILSIDTEFPGCIRSTPLGSTEEQLYTNFRFNVTQTKLIQLGITASNERGEVGGTWEFNFSDFDYEIDTRNASSISFLKENGLDFEKLKKDGIPLRVFGADFVHILRKNMICKWVTFQGLYDIGYVLKAMGFVRFPESFEEFGVMVVNKVGIVRDLKHMAQFCEGLEGGRIGLEKLGELMGVKRFGMKHHAGSDSLITAGLHLKIIEVYGLESSICDGYLFGVSKTLTRPKFMIRPSYVFPIIKVVPGYNYPMPMLIRSM